MAVPGERKNILLIGGGKTTRAKQTEVLAYLWQDMLEALEG
jgi:hypothetical protein